MHRCPEFVCTRYIEVNDYKRYVECELHAVLWPCLAGTRKIYRLCLH